MIDLDAIIRDAFNSENIRSKIVTFKDISYSLPYESLGFTNYFLLGDSLNTIEEVQDRVEKELEKFINEIKDFIKDNNFADYIICIREKNALKSENNNFALNYSYMNTFYPPGLQILFSTHLYHPEKMLSLKEGILND